jgi:hypothetical protein
VVYSVTDIINTALSLLNVEPMSEKDLVMAEKFIQKAIKHPGALRKTLKVKKGEKIPLAKLKKAEHSKNPLTAKRAHLAETMRGFKKGK